MTVLYVCRSCGCPDIESECWVEVNSDRIIDSSSDGYWCPECDRLTSDGHQRWWTEVESERLTLPRLRALFSVLAFTEGGAA